MKIHFPSHSSLPFLLSYMIGHITTTCTKFKTIRHTSHSPPSQIHSTRDGSLSRAEKRVQSRESHLSFRKFREHSPRYVRLLKSSLHSGGYSFSLFHAHFNKHIADKIAHCYTLSVSMRLTTALKSLEFFPKGHAGFS